MTDMPAIGNFIAVKLIDGQLARGEVMRHGSKDGLPIIEFHGSRVLDDGSNGAVSDLWVWPSQVISVEAPAVQRSLFEVVGGSFNGADDQTDHQVFWVMADSGDQVKSALVGTSAVFCGPVLGALGDCSVDYELPGQAGEFKIALLALAADPSVI